MAAEQVRYISFPIACLQVGQPIQDVDAHQAEIVVDKCLNWHLHNIAKTANEEDEIVLRVAEREAKTPTYKVDATNLKPDQIRLLYALQMANVLWPLDLYSIRNNVAADYKTVNASQGASRVLFPVDIYWDARKSWTYRQFAICCAVWAALGNNLYKQITYDKIAYHAIGFTNKAAMVAAGKSIDVLSRDQIRWTIDELERSKMIYRTPMHRRAIAYSRALPVEQLIMQVRKDLAERKNIASPMAMRLEQVQGVSTQHPS
jgi:hypothetical protein